MKKLGYVKVTRTDDSVQYFEKFLQNDNTITYFPVGGGFSIVQFRNVKSVEDIDEVPVQLHRGWVGIDKPQYEAFVDVNDRWNGWQKPYTLANEIPKLVAELSVDDTYKGTRLEGNVLIIIHDDEEEERINEIELSGERVFYLGNLGWCWDFFATKEDYNDEIE